MTISHTDNNMCVDLGRITVGYVTEQKVVKVIHNHTGEVLRCDEVGEMNVQAFTAVARKYARIMGVEV